MKAIGMISWKGGTGKTTIASNLNERATAHGLDTVVIDMDPQLNAVRYLNFRQQHSPDASPIQVFEGGMDMRSIQSIQTMLKAEKHDLMICDLPGTDAFTMDRAFELMDLLLIPLSPSPFDISDTIDLITHCRDKEWPTWVIPFNLPVGQKRTDQMIHVLDRIEAKVVPVRLKRRVTYVDASTMGLGVCEYEPNSQAAAEMNELWEWTRRTVQLPQTDADTWEGHNDARATQKQAIA